MTRLLAIDTETFLIGAPHPEMFGTDIIPECVCLSHSMWGDTQTPVTGLQVPWEHDIEGYLRFFLTDPETIIVGHNLAYDMHVLRKRYPALLPDMRKAYTEGRCFDTRVAEQVLNMRKHGSINLMPTPDGGATSLSYHLTDLELKYTGVDRSAQKGEDTWRMNYNLLYKMPLAEWPVDAAKYAKDDAEATLVVASNQWNELLQSNQIRTVTQRTEGAFCLMEMTKNGVPVDPERVAEVREDVAASVDPSNFTQLIASGILRPPTPPRPHANGAKAHVDGCPDSKKGSKAECECPPKMTAGAGESINTILLAEHILDVCRRHKIPVALTDTGKKQYRHEFNRKVAKLDPDDSWLNANTKYISADNDTRTPLEALCPIIAEYGTRQEKIKLHTTYLPQLHYRDGDLWSKTYPDRSRVGEVADRVHFLFDVVKETGRTSSYSSSLYPSANGQNMDPRIRSCYIAEPNHVILSWDYSALELVAFSHQCRLLFGFSKMGDLIDAGVDLHAYMGAQLAFAQDDDFRTVCERSYGSDNQMGRYEVFIEYKKHDPEFFKFWRKLAKPVGLGYPGGLGAETMITYARGTYGVSFTLETARRAKEVWLQTYPEAGLFFDHISNNCVDPYHVFIDEEDGRKKDRYWYTTPDGLIRSNCAYTEACNGNGMQSPSASGAIPSVSAVVWECIDWTLDSCLFGAIPFDFVHDEILLQIPTYKIGGTEPMVKRVDELMCSTMQKVLYTTTVRGEGALMHRWYKEADPVLNSNGDLIPWTPSDN